MPTYNRLDLCLQSIDSVLSQSFQDFEIIVIDDGSTDGTKEHFELFFNQNIHYIFQQNGGVSSARNVGIRHSRGQYICYLDSDDEWSSNKLLEINRFIKTNPGLDVVFHDFVKHDLTQPLPFSTTNSQIFPRIYNLFEQVAETTHWLSARSKSIELMLTGYPFYPSVLTVSRSVHDQYLWDPGVLKSEDFNLILKLALRYDFGYIDCNLATIKVHENNKSHDIATKDTVILNTLLATQSLYCDSNLRPLFSKYLYKRFFYTGLKHLKVGNYKLGFRWLFRALVNLDFYFSLGRK